MSEVPQEELDREVGLKPDELLGFFQISSQIHQGINDWLSPPSGVTAKSGKDFCDNLIVQIPKLLSELTALHDRIQEIWDRAGFDYKIIDPKVPDDEIRVKCGDLLSLANVRAQISNELNQWLHPESVVPKGGTDLLGHLINRLERFPQPLESLRATLDRIRERNFGEQTEADSAHKLTTAKPVLPPPIPPEYLTNKQAELHTIKVGGRAIVLPAPDNGCQRCDHLGKHPLVPFTFRQRLLAFFIAGDATPTQARYFYVQCVRFGAGINETRETYAKLQAAIVLRDQTKGSIFDVTEDSLCMWNFYAPINMIFTTCMMLVAGRVLHLYGMCHRDLSTTEREQIVMKSWRDRIIKANPDDKLSGHDVMGDSPMSECEEIATTINRLVKAGYIPKAQELLDSSLDAYFVLQLAMFADKNVNAYITIAAWKQAGLRLPAEDTAEFYPYGDSPKQE